MVNENKILIGKYTDKEGIEKTIVVEAGHPGRWNYRVWGEPTTKGKKQKAYREMRSRLGDDWSSDITDIWFEPGLLSVKIQQKISDTIEGLRKAGYTRY